jgi:myo-inositol 2-dehydrogenase/D-chiro-inositol 1-dehydrogenase
MTVGGGPVRGGPVRVGVIGVGMIGQDHVRRLTQALSGARVTAITDVDPAKAAQTAAGLPDVRVHGTGQEVIQDEGVDAVLVASWGPTHEEYVLAAIAAGKPVFCEKPLAESGAACLRITAAEAAGGRRLVQVGYMRRFDPAYRALKQVIDGGRIGTPLIMHCAHRNRSVPDWYRRESAITDTAVHEIDLIRWLFDEEIVAVQVLAPRRNRNGGQLQDPLMILFETESGVIVDLEVSVNIRYGYDIRGEVVGEDGTVALGEITRVVVRSEGTLSCAVPMDWRERFAQAYDVELQEWIVNVAGGTASGPSSWDGYVAAAVAEAGLEAMQTRNRVGVTLADKPAFYRNGHHE